MKKSEKYNCAKYFKDHNLQDWINKREDIKMTPTVSVQSVKKRRRKRRFEIHIISTDNVKQKIVIPVVESVTLDSHLYKGHIRRSAVAPKYLYNNQYTCENGWRIIKPEICEVSENILYGKIITISNSKKEITGRVIEANIEGNSRVRRNKYRKILAENILDSVGINNAITGDEVPAPEIRKPKAARLIAHKKIAAKHEASKIKGYKAGTGDEIPAPPIRKPIGEHPISVEPPLANPTVTPRRKKKKHRGKNIRRKKNGFIR